MLKLTNINGSNVCILLSYATLIVLIDLFNITDDYDHGCTYCLVSRIHVKFYVVKKCWVSWIRKEYRWT